MKTRDVLGAWWGDALPNGVYAAMVPESHLEVTSGRVMALPPGEPWGLHDIRITEVGGFKIAGQAHSTVNVTGLWVEDKWTFLPGPVVGVNAVIFDRQGELHRSDGSRGGQGFRFVDAAGRIWTGDETIYDAVMGIHEWTRLASDLWIGQGHEDGAGARVWDGKQRRVFEVGSCRSIRATVEGDKFAVAITLRDRVRFYWGTLDELRELPVEVQPVPPPVPPPKPPVPPPVPVPPPPPPIEEKPVISGEEREQIIAALGNMIGGFVHKSAEFAQGVRQTWDAFDKIEANPTAVELLQGAFMRDQGYSPEEVEHFARIAVRLRRG